MHILVINDDGPPSNQSSPYIHPFIHYLQQAGHLVSVILPHQQRSWIGKAHFVGQLTKPTYYRPGTIHEDNTGSTHPKPSVSDSQEEWILVDGTPATCAQLGLHHFFKSRPSIDLVVSGPNYGRNSTSLFSLSSGTIGGAMEAAVCQKRAIALSFAFWSRDHQAELIAQACKHSIRLIEHLMAHWGTDVDLYSINVPLKEGVGREKIMYTHALQNYWTSGSSFEEIDAEDEADPQQQERDIREIGEGGAASDGGTHGVKGKENISKEHKWFKWAPKFGDIQKSIDESAPGNDGWAIHQGYTSVTPLKANYMHAADVSLGELKLAPTSGSDSSKAVETPSPATYAVIDADAYTLPLIKKTLYSILPSVIPIISTAQLPALSSPLLQILPYEDIDFNHHLAHPTISLANSFIIRKALIRKNYLSTTVSTWQTKHPQSTLQSHVPLTVNFELDYAEFLDDALLECFELHTSFAQTEREWWVLKPAMSDQGNGVRLFSSFDELQSIFEEWEPTTSDDDEEEDEADEQEAPENTLTRVTPANTMTSQLRHFIAQRYIDPPLLFPEHNNRKFHIRSYVLAVGALTVYVYREMLALFAPEPYHPPTTTDLDPRVHLTNTCLHSSSSSSSSKAEPNDKPPQPVHKFWDLPSTPSPHTTDWKPPAFTQILSATATLFEAAAREQMIHFQCLPNSFEVFGVDWMVDAQGHAWLLEVNAFPDFKQSGEELSGVVEGLWKSVFRRAVVPFFGGGGEKGEDDGMVQVLDIDLGRR